MGNKKYTATDVNAMLDSAYSDGLAEGKATAEHQKGTEPEHGSYTLTVRYKHTKYADEVTDFTTALVKELAEDEFRFVTDHFDVLAVEVTDDSTWAN